MSYAVLPKDESHTVGKWGVTSHWKVRNNPRAKGTVEHFCVSSLCYSGEVVHKLKGEGSFRTLRDYADHCHAVGYEPRIIDTKTRLDGFDPAKNDTATRALL